MAQRALLGNLKMSRNLAQRGLAMRLQEGENHLALGLHKVQFRSFSTETLKYLPTRLATAAAALIALWPSAMLAAPEWEQWQAVPAGFHPARPPGGRALGVGRAAAPFTPTPARGRGAFAPRPGRHPGRPHTQA